MTKVVLVSTEIVSNELKVTVLINDVYQESFYVPAENNNCSIAAKAFIKDWADKYLLEKEINNTPPAPINLNELIGQEL